ncbi:hypothetical protein P389DRAFT_57264 [Cystobasidium minutum MCA 4210]|uniref:uncharacterized protein n=1 Tax=Cystobasidium minutum MCA 4210 TaxID=1397322 RepID=UPI0034CDE126|eukprot:jgi/Rhomi1/57264/CE57263_7280
MGIAGLPEDGKDRMRAAVYYDGICGTDLHEWHDGANFHPKPGCPHPVSGLNLPLVIGHEFSGTIEKVGSSLEGKYKTGQKICAQPDFGCGKCDVCKSGNRNVCQKMGFVGLSGPPGGLGQYTVLKPENIHVLPNNISLDAGAMIEPLAVAWHATRKADVKAGDVCLVIGSGPIGAFVIRSLKAQGVKRIICAEPAKERQGIAKHSGADNIVNPTKEDVAEVCMKLTDGRGVDVAFDAAGLPNGATLNMAVKCTRSLGQITNIAIYGAPVNFDLHALYMGEKTLNGIIGYTAQDFKDVIQAVSDGRIECEDLCTARIQLDNLVEGGFKELINNKETHVKILVKH